MKDLNNDQQMMDEYAQLEWRIFKTMDINHMTVEEISTSNLHCHCDSLESKLGYWDAAHVKAEPYIIDNGKT